MKKSEEIDDGFKTATDFDLILGKIINPLIEKTKVVLKLKELSEDEEDELFSLFAVGVVQGSELAAKTDAQLDVEHKKALQHLKEPSKMQETFNKHKQARSAAAALSMGKDGQMLDGTPRFVTPDQFDPLTGQYKGNK